MKQSLIIFISFGFLLIAPLFFIAGCDSSNPTIPDAESTGSTNNTSVTGSVVEFSTGNVIDSALVKINYVVGTSTSYSTTSGVYTANFNIDTNRFATIITSKVGYKTDTTQIFISKNSTVSLKSIILSKVASTSTVQSGPPSAIYLLSQSLTNLGVRGSGSPETGTITFQIVDTLGNPIDIAHSALVKFSFGGRPNGDEFLSPTLAFSDSLGRVKTVLTSGTNAGIVQILAETNTGSKTITSLPVSYTIFGGHPTQSHLGIAAQTLNFPGLKAFGLINSITAYCGDKYSNPVRPGTSVYFTSTGGIIEGFAQTSSVGSASVRLMSAEPRPVDATYGAGFALVTASTADETSSIISKSMYILFSGTSSVAISPTTFDIPNGGAQEFIFEAKDENGNPLVSGTNIQVSVEGENVKTSGETSYTMPDTQSKAYTKFHFAVYDSNDTVNVAKRITIKVSSTGSNGEAKTSITGISR